MAEQQHQQHSPSHKPSTYNYTVKPQKSADFFYKLIFDQQEVLGSTVSIPHTQREREKEKITLILDIHHCESCRI